MNIGCVTVAYLWISSWIQLGNAHLEVTKQPSGPLICKGLCERIGGCSVYNFNPTDLLCNVSTFHGTRRSDAKIGALRIMMVKKKTKNGVHCPTDSLMVKSKTHGTHYVELSNKRKLRPVMVQKTPYETSVADSGDTPFKPGDIVVFGYGTQSVVVQRGKGVYCSRRGGQVHIGNLTTSKYTLHIKRGKNRLFSPKKRVARAMEWVGKRFNEGEMWGDEAKWLCDDFVPWICTGRSLQQADSRGFELLPDFMH